MKRPAPTPEQRAALDRARKQPTHPYRANAVRPLANHEVEKIAPYRARLVRR